MQLNSVPKLKSLRQRQWAFPWIPEDNINLLTSVNKDNLLTIQKTIFINKSNPDANTTVGLCKHIISV